jgi:hypothetical protein
VLLQGIATQVFTEVGNYHIPVAGSQLTLRQKLAVVTCAISIDYDYYSRRAGSGGWLWPAAIYGGDSHV